jgi:hypothetical protein
LSPANDILVPIGFGLHHSGVEIMGTEYSFGSGAGIFEGPPKQAPGARFRYQLEMGAFDGGQTELNHALDDLRGAGFGNSDYNLVKRNCNHFADALVWRLLKVRLPGYVNRLADCGNFCSCLLPKKLLEDSHVGGNGNNDPSTSSFLVPTSGSMKRGARVAPMAFSGTGHSLGDKNSAGNNAFSGWVKSIKSSNDQDESLTDRRERARKAALARLDKGRQEEKQQN